MRESLARVYALVRKELLAMLKDPRARWSIIVPPVLQCLIFGYAAMSLLLDAISRATAEGGHQVTRSSVLKQLFETHNLPSVLGTYSIDGRGDTTLDRFGVYHVVNGQLMFWQARRG